MNRLFELIKPKKVIFGKKHAQQIYLIKDYLVSKVDIGFYVGGMKPQELRKSQEKDILLATFSMASEGMDIPELDTVILDVSIPYEESFKENHRQNNQNSSWRERARPLQIRRSISSKCISGQWKKQICIYRHCTWQTGRNPRTYFSLGITRETGNSWNNINS